MIARRIATTLAGACALVLSCTAEGPIPFSTSAAGGGSGQCVSFEVSGNCGSQHGNPSSHKSCTDSLTDVSGDCVCRDSLTIPVPCGSPVSCEGLCSLFGSGGNGGSAGNGGVGGSGGGEACEEICAEIEDCEAACECLETKCDLPCIACPPDGGSGFGGSAGLGGSAGFGGSSGFGGSAGAGGTGGSNELSCFEDFGECVPGGADCELDQVCQSFGLEFSCVYEPAPAQLHEDCWEEKPCAEGLICLTGECLALCCTSADCPGGECFEEGVCQW